jgi:hypothetical protein
MGIKKLAQTFFQHHTHPSMPNTIVAPVLSKEPLNVYTLKLHRSTYHLHITYRKEIQTYIYYHEYSILSQVHLKIDK